MPKIVIYDGMKESAINELKECFSERLILFDQNTLSVEEKRRIHGTTSAFIHKKLVSNDVDFLLCFGDKILKKPLIDAYPNRLINFHPSLLPSYKGLYAIDQALKSNAVFLGNTAHYIDEGIDTGRIIVQTAMLKEDFNEYEDVLELQFPMIKMVLRDIVGYTIATSSLFEEIKDRKYPLFIPKSCNN